MNNQQAYASNSKNLLKRPKPMKKVMKPAQSRPFSERSPPPRQNSPTPGRSQVKQQKFDDSSVGNSDISNTGTICPKQEPLDLPEDYSDNYDEHMDVSSMLDTTLGEPSSRALTFSPKSSTQDTSSPGKRHILYIFYLCTYVNLNQIFQKNENKKRKNFKNNIYTEKKKKILYIMR